MNNWVENEIAAATMKDKRLRDRLAKLLMRLGGKPEESIPSACQGWAETQAAYRFLDNGKVSFDEILKGHRLATIGRIKAQPVVLLVQDTTFLTYSTEEAKQGFGTLRKTENERYLLHPTVAFTPDRTSLGVMDAKFWQRPEMPVAHLRSQKRIEEKESIRWLESYNVACDVQKQCPDTLIVSIADREGDIHEWFLAAEQRAVDEKAEFIIRAKCNRRVDKEDEEASYLWNELDRCSPLGKYNFETKPQKNRKARKVTLSLHAKEVTFTGKAGGHKKPPVTLTAVYAVERKPRKGETAVEWMLLTSLPVEDFKAAQTVVGWYQCRWEIEIYFRTLKQGCAIEDLRLETDKRLLNCIAVYMIVAWRIHTITMMSRSHSHESCELLFSEKEWKTIYLMQQKKKPPTKPPTLSDIVRMMSQLGGFLARKGDGEPGVKNVWRGYQSLQHYVTALEMSRDLSICV